MENALNMKILYELTELVKESNYLIDKQEKEISQLRTALDEIAKMNALENKLVDAQYVALLALKVEDI